MRDGLIVTSVQKCGIEGGGGAGGDTCVALLNGIHARVRRTRHVDCKRACCASHVRNLIVHSVRGALSAFIAVAKCLGVGMVAMHAEDCGAAGGERQYGDHEHAHMRDVAKPSIQCSNAPQRLL